MREKGQNEVAKTLETPVFSRGREILTEKKEFPKSWASDTLSGNPYFLRRGPLSGMGY